MNFLTKILDTYRKGLKYEELEKDFSKLAEEYQGTEDFYKKETLNLTIQNTALKEQIKTLLREQVIDLEVLKDYYESKYGDAIWLYDIHGDGYEDAKNALAVDEAEDATLKEAALWFINEYGLVSNNPTRVVESVMKYFTGKRQWTYTTDNKLFNKGEYWNSAGDSWIGRKGDCDDLAILMHNLIYYIFDTLELDNYYWRLKLCAGGTLTEGHCFNIWLHDDGEWYVVESTLDLKGSLAKTWLKTPMRENNLYSETWGFARKDRSWKGKSDSLNPKGDDE
jgi:hypothetical protein